MIVGDPRADRLVVIDDLGCQVVVKGSTAEWVWRSCDWELSAFSSDGRLVAGRSVMYGTIGIIDLSTGELVLGIDQGKTPVGPQMVFDEAGRLNFRVGSPPVGQPKIGTRVDGFAFVVCDLAGDVLALHRQPCRPDRIRIAEPQVNFSSGSPCPPLGPPVEARTLRVILLAR